MENRPSVKVTVTESLKHEQWLNIFLNGWLIASLWGTAEVTYTPGVLDLAKYRLAINGTDAFIHADEIKRQTIAEAVGLKEVRE